MGPLFSRFRRKQTTVELLEEIDKEINRLQRNRKVNQDRQKQFVTSLLIYSIAAYVIAAVIFFCICFPETWQLRLLYSVPLLIFPVLVWAVKRSLHWYFVQRISSNDTALEDLRDRKNQILEDVMETETYKKAREILEKFDAARLHKLEGVPETMTYDTPGLPKFRPPDVGTAGTLIQQRTSWTVEHFPARMQGPSIHGSGLSSAIQEQNGAPHLCSPVVQENLTVSQTPAQAVIAAEFALPPRPPMPRSVLPRERGVMDKLMDYLVGDGPDNRYALICQQCYSHNGMALKEEFEYLSFRCCYCYWINPARKQRPTAPRLQFFAPPGMRPPENADTTPSGDDGDDDENEEDDHIASHQSSSKPDTSEDVSLVQSLEASLLSVSAVSSSAPLSGNTEESSGPELGDSRCESPVPDCDIIKLGPANTRDILEVPRADYDGGLASDNTRTLETWPGSQQSTSQGLHSLQIQHVTTPVCQHPDGPEPETMQVMMQVQHQITHGLKPFSCLHSSIEPMALSSEDLRNSLKADFPQADFPQADYPQTDFPQAVEPLTTITMDISDGAHGADHDRKNSKSEVNVSRDDSCNDSCDLAVPTQEDLQQYKESLKDGQEDV